MNNNPKDYHKTDLHKRLINDVCLNLVMRYNNKVNDISEYDTQAVMDLFLKNNLLNTEFQANRERFSKFDCAISRKSDKKPVILYELKTYLKKSEKINTNDSVSKILKDINKIAKKITSESNKNPNSAPPRGYFIIATSTSKFPTTGKKLPEKIQFIERHSNGDKKWQLFTQDSENQGLNIWMRPSRMQKILNVAVLSWEIILKPA